MRSGCRAIAAAARWVEIDLESVTAIEPGPPPALDPQRHYLEGDPSDVAAYPALGPLVDLQAPMIDPATLDSTVTTDLMTQAGIL